MSEFVLGWCQRCGRGADGTWSPVADSKLVYRRYASLFFVTGIGQQDNELITLEIIHRYVARFGRSYAPQCAHADVRLATLRSYVEVLDRYFGNVSPAALRM